MDDRNILVGFQIKVTESYFDPPSITLMLGNYPIKTWTPTYYSRWSDQDITDFVAQKLTALFPDETDDSDNS